MGFYSNLDISRREVDTIDQLFDRSYPSPEMQLVYRLNELISLYEERQNRRKDSIKRNYCSSLINNFPTSKNLSNRTDLDDLLFELDKAQEPVPYSSVSDGDYISDKDLETADPKILSDLDILRAIEILNQKILANDNLKSTLWEIAPYDCKQIYIWLKNNGFPTDFHSSYHQENSLPSYHVK